MNFKKLTFFFCVLVIGFTPLDALTISDNLTLGYVFFVLMSICAVLSGSLLPPKHMPEFAKLLIAFIVWATLTSIWSYNIDTTLYRVMYLIQYFMIVLVMLNVINTSKRLKIVLGVWALGALYIAIKTATDFNTFAANSSDLYRVDEFGNPNENSFMLVWALIFVYLIDTTKRKMPSLSFTLVSAYAIVANGSRMGFILFVVTLLGFIFSFFNKKMNPLHIVVVLTVLYIGGSFLMQYIPESSFSRLMFIGSNIENHELANRDIIWLAAYNALSTNPQYLLLGSGWGTFNEAIQLYAGYAIGAHNFYINILFTTGIIGTSIVLRYLYVLYKYIHKTANHTIITYLVLVVPLISMSSTNWDSRRWWFLMGTFIYLILKTNNFGNENARRKISR